MQPLNAATLVPTALGARVLEWSLARGDHTDYALVAPVLTPCGLVPGSELRMYALGSQFHGIRLCARFLRGPAALTSMAVRFVGSVGSSYATGVMAGLADCSKKVMTHSVSDPEGARLRSMLRSAIRSGKGRSLLLSLHGVGCRVAVTDACFLSVHWYLAYERHWPAASSFAAAAASGIFGKVLLDTFLARHSDAPRPSTREALRSGAAVLRASAEALRAPEREDLAKVARGAARRFRGSYRGTAARVLEFAIGYICTKVVHDTLTSMSEL